MRVLLIEDDSSMARSIELMLKSDGHVVDVADIVAIAAVVVGCC